MESRRALFTLFAVIGCGRVNFEPLGTSSPGDAVDADATPRACPIGTTAPDPITVTGHAVSINAFLAFDPEPGVTVTTLTAIGGATITTGTTDGNADFAVPVPTGGRPLAPYLTLAKTNLLTSVWVPDQPADADVAMGTAYMSTPGGTSALYNVVLRSRDAARGTLLVEVTDCAGGGIGGARITITPAPEDIVYSGLLGAPVATATSTGPSGRAWALNVPAGTVQVTASKSGLTFYPHDVTILAGDYFTGTPIRHVP